MSERRKPEREVPVGLEKLLYCAAIDPAFRETLLRDRARAATERGVELSPSERSMLGLASEEQLTASIAALDTSEAGLARRGFLRAVAGAVTLAAGSVLTGCGDEEDKVGGIRPSDAGPDFHQGPEIGGIRPGDVGADRRASDGVTDRPFGLDSAGIRPDELGTGTKD